MIPHLPFPAAGTAVPAQSGCAYGSPQWRQRVPFRGPSQQANGFRSDTCSAKDFFDARSGSADVDSSPPKC